MNYASTDLYKKNQVNRIYVEKNQRHSDEGKNIEQIYAELC